MTTLPILSIKDVINQRGISFWVCSKLYPNSGKLVFRKAKDSTLIGEYSANIKLSNEYKTLIVNKDIDLFDLNREDICAIELDEYDDIKRRCTKKFKVLKNQRS